ARPRLHSPAGIPQARPPAGDDRDRRHRHLLPHLRLERVRLRRAPDLRTGADHAALHSLHHRRGRPGLAGGRGGDHALPRAHPGIHRALAQEPLARNHVRGGEKMTSRWPRILRRGRMEAAAIVVISAGVFMLLQPFSMALYTWSFVTTLSGTALFTVVSRFPE